MPRLMLGMKDIYEIRLDNALALVDQAGGPGAFAARIDREPTQVSRIVGKGRTKNIGPRMARHIEQCFGKPRGWLDTDQSTPSPHESNVEGPKIPLRRGSVPVLGTAQLGPNGFFEALDYPVGFGDGRLLVESNDKDAYGVKVVGNSMMPRIKHNEYVVIEPNHCFVSGDEVMVETTDGRAMIKEFIYLRDGQYRFDSINQDFEPMHLNESDVKNVHYVAAIVKPTRYLP